LKYIFSGEKKYRSLDTLIWKGDLRGKRLEGRRLEREKLLEEGLYLELDDSVYVDLDLEREIAVCFYLKERNERDYSQR